MSKSSVDAAPQEIPLSIGAMATCLEEIHIDRHLHLVDPPDTIVSRGTKQLIGTPLALSLPLSPSLSVSLSLSLSVSLSLSSLPSDTPAT
jgi:hypothetical protein